MRKEVLSGCPSTHRFVEDYTGEDKAYVNHLMPQLFDHIVEKCHKADIICTPLRHPSRVYESFVRRGQSIESMLQQWRLMAYYLDEKQPFYVHIDEDVRDADVKALRSAAGLPDRDIDWTPVGNEHNTNLLSTTNNKSQDWVMDFYRRTLNG